MNGAWCGRIACPSREKQAVTPGSEPQTPVPVPLLWDGNTGQPPGNPGKPLEVPFSGDGQGEKSRQSAKHPPALWADHECGWWPLRTGVIHREQEGSKGGPGSWVPGEACDVLQVQWLLLSGWPGASGPPSSLVQDRVL